MNAEFKKIALEIMENETVKRFLEHAFKKVTQEVLAEKKKSDPDYFPGIYYLNNYKVFCITNAFLLRELCEFVGGKDMKKVIRLKESLLKAGEYENDWRNFLLDVFKYQHNVFHEMKETKSYIRFAPAIYENRHGHAYEVQQIKLYSPTLTLMNLESEMEHLQRVFEDYPIRQLAYSHGPVGAFYRKNSAIPRVFR